MASQSLLDHWPVLFMSVLMVVGAVIDGWKLKVPNRLTFPMILSGWLYWAVLGGSAFDYPTWWKPVLLSVGGTFAAGLPLLLFWIIGGMGSGDVKLYAGFGAWMVPIPWFGFENLFYAFAYSVILGAVMGLAIMAWNNSWFVNMENTRDILKDLQTESLDEVTKRAKERKPKLQLLPYGVPLTIGSLAYVAYMMGSQLSG